MCKVICLSCDKQSSMCFLFNWQLLTYVWINTSTIVLVLVLYCSGIVLVLATALLVALFVTNIVIIKISSRRRQKGHLFKFWQSSLIFSLNMSSFLSWMITCEHLPHSTLPPDLTEWWQADLGQWGKDFCHQLNCRSFTLNWEMTVCRPKNLDRSNQASSNQTSEKDFCCMFPSPSCSGASLDSLALSEWCLVQVSDAYLVFSAQEWVMPPSIAADQPL